MDQSVLAEDPPDGGVEIGLAREIGLLQGGVERDGRGAGSESLDGRLERGFADIRERMEKVERRWEEDEKARRREWEALEGRTMTTIEEHRHYNDGLLRKMSVMTEAQINILREFSEDMQREFAEGRAQLRANTEAVLKMLDGLPPAGNG